MRTYQVRIAVLASIGLLATCLGSPRGTEVAAQAVDAGRGTVPSAVSPDRLRVTLLGTGGGPVVNLQQFGASTLVEAGGRRLLFDCGRGATLRLTEAGIPIGAISQLFLTHLHSDHVMQIPDLFLAGAIGTTGRQIPLEVWGPNGTREMMTAIEKAFSVDVRSRRPSEGFTVRSNDIQEGVIFDDDGLRVTAFLVNHAPFAPSFGYRVDFRGRSVALSGDTDVAESLIKTAAGVDVLIHEAAGGTGETASSALDAHTTADQVGQVFARVKPRVAVISHARNSEALIARARKHYSGPLYGPQDLLTIDIGEEIEVRRPKR
jgi:ribonuclease Z